MYIFRLKFVYFRDFMIDGKNCGIICKLGCVDFENIYRRNCLVY